MADLNHGGHRKELLPIEEERNKLLKLKPNTKDLQRDVKK